MIRTVAPATGRPSKSTIRPVIGTSFATSTVVPAAVGAGLTAVLGFSPCGSSARTCGVRYPDSDQPRRDRSNQTQQCGAIAGRLDRRPGPLQQSAREEAKRQQRG